MWRYDDKDFKSIVDFIHPGISHKSLAPSTFSGSSGEDSSSSTGFVIPPSVRIFTHGIPVKNPGYSNNRREHDCKTKSVVDNILHLSDLLNDVALARVAGPFKINDNVDHVIISPHPGKYFKVPLFYHSRFCTHKQKRRQSKGRRVTDLSGSGLNALYNKSESSVHNLPSLRYIMALLDKKE